MQKVLLNVPLSIYSGYGNDGIGIARAFVDRGWDVYLQPAHVDPPLPNWLAALLTKELVGPFDLGVAHVDPGMISASAQMRLACHKLVGWTMWEMDSLGNLGAKKLATARYRYQLFDAIFCYDEVSRGALAPYAADVPLPVVQGGYEPDFWKPVQRDWHSERFGYCQVGVLSERKNPFASIEAFRRLKAEYPDEFAGAELHMKDGSRLLHPKIAELIPKLRIHHDTWPKEKLRAFYGFQHVLLAPSRGEGKNMPALEFQTTGGAVIATDWGGHRGWLSSEYAYPLPYRLEQIPMHPDVHWASVDLDALCEAMLHVYRHRDEVARKAELAARTIPAMCSWDTAVDRLLAVVERTEPRKVDLIRNWELMADAAAN